MRKIITAALAALTFGGAVLATAAPAAARPYGDWNRGGWNHGGYRYYGHHHHGNDAGVAIAAGVVGLALGAALASDSGHRGYYSNGYYSNGYYGRSYSPGYYYNGGYYNGGYGYYDEGYRICESSRLVWDPYIRRRVEVRSRYAC